MAKSKRKNSKSKKRPIPLAPPPGMRSRKRARVVTTTFHKLTREKDLAQKRGDEEEVKRCDERIVEMGGREEYQRASQLSTSFHSTSRWVLGYLARNGWLYGITQGDATAAEGRKKKKPPRRKMRLLEVGAINTELLNAASQTKTVDLEESEGAVTTTIRIQEQPKYRLDVRAIDLHSSHDGIEKADFLQVPLLHSDPLQRYDAVVCSMVINCVTTPEHRGLMLARLFLQLRPGGLCFLTLPKLCLQQSPYVTAERFLCLLKDGVGFEVKETKDSPKVAFFILRRPVEEADGDVKQLDPKWSKLSNVRRGAKFRNKFSVVLKTQYFAG